MEEMPSTRVEKKKNQMLCAIIAHLRERDQPIECIYSAEFVLPRCVRVETCVKAQETTDVGPIEWFGSKLRLVVGPYDIAPIIV
jgi:hypothetical protein